MKQVQIINAINKYFQCQIAQLDPTVHFNQWTWTSSASPKHKRPFEHTVLFEFNP